LLCGYKSIIGDINWTPMNMHISSKIDRFVFKNLLKLPDQEFIESMGTFLKFRTKNQKPKGSSKDV
jgi:hypothetical protein